MVQLTLDSATHTDSRHDQASKILQYLKSGKKLTPIDALNLFGCFRLGARVWELKQAGHPIQKDMITLPNSKRVAEYRYEITKQ